MFNLKYIAMAHNDELIMKLAKCAAACEECLDACLEEDNKDMLVECMRTDRDCAKICHLAAGFVASHSQFTGSVLTLCEELCRACAEECDKHEHDHCKRCADSCRVCANACSSYAA
jgi:hypothetical protein